MYLECFKNLTVLYEKRESSCLSFFSFLSFQENSHYRQALVSFREIKLRKV